jgi:hypothetical protein
MEGGDDFLLGEIEEFADELEALMYNAPPAPAPKNARKEEFDAPLSGPEDFGVLLEDVAASRLSTLGSIAKDLTVEDLLGFSQEGSKWSSKPSLNCSVKVAGAHVEEAYEFLSLGFAFRHLYETLSVNKAESKAADAFALSMQRLIGQDNLRGAALQSIYSILKPSFRGKYWLCHL